MALQVYACPVHGEFDVDVPLTQDVSPDVLCPLQPGAYRTPCGRKSLWVLKAPSTVIIKGDRAIDHGFERDAQQLAAEKLRTKQGRKR